MSALWSVPVVAEATGGRLRGAPPEAIEGVSIDSRTIAPGDAFFAIAGPNFDGHDFAAAALRAGAALAVVSEGREPDAGPLLVVPDDPLAALTRLGAAARARMTGGIVAVTGSVGKTGTTAMLRLALSASGRTHAPVGSFNNHWGVPLTLARMPASSTYGVFEIGMNHAGEIRPLTRLVRPHVAVITTVEAVHLEFFDSEEGIAAAKAEIFEGLEPGGSAVLNRDNRWFELLSSRAREAGAEIVSFGESSGADVRLTGLVIEDDGASVKADVRGKPVSYRLGAPGRHLALNSLAVIAALRALGGDLAGGLAALAEFRAPKGRGQRLGLRHPGGTFTVIDESYNANPVSMRAALALLGNSEPGAGGRRIAVLGDMRELGEQAAAMHADLAGAVEASHADTVHLVGPLMENLRRALPESLRGAYSEGPKAVEAILLDAVGPGDVVMIKASLGTKLGSLVEALKRRFAAEAP